MAAIDQYLRQILEATYGEEVRHSIHDAILQNYMDVSESVAQANAAADTAEQALADASTVVDKANSAAQTAETAVQDANTAVTNANSAVEAANTAITNANEAASGANTAKEEANAAAANANDKAQLADEKATLADTKAQLADTAVANANTAAQNATKKATLADTKAQLADTAAQNATEKANLADAAAGLADTAATNANEKADLAATAATNANEKATLADTAAQNADTKAGLADTAATNANEKATLAETAATNADEKATLANDAATIADEKATLADTAATNANTARDEANTAATNANEKATLANTAAANADNKATLAETAATNADTAAQNANEKATLAETAATNADEKATLADTKAQLAETAATNADTKAGLANDAADRANEISDAIEPIISTDTETVTGNPVTVETQSAQIAEKTVVKLEPKQDLHGYDHPWPAGGGKNKAPMMRNSTNKGITVTVDDDGVVTANGTNTAGTVGVIGQSEITILKAGSYILSGSASANTGVTIQVVKNDDGTISNITRDYVGNGSAFTLEEDTPVAVRGYISADANVSDLKLYPMIRLASETDATYEPYENICPIEGFDGVEVKRTGKNLFDKNDVETNLMINTDGTITSQSRAVLSDYILIDYNPITISAINVNPDKSSNYSAIRIGFYDENKNFIERVTTGNPIEGNTKYKKSFSQYAKYVRVNYFINDFLDNAQNVDIQLELGETATEYEPFGKTIHITIPTEAGTVYSGTITIEKDGSGKLVVDSANIASYAGETLPCAWISDRDVYSAGATPTTGAQVVYDLATPITYTLTAEQVTLLKGINHIFTDATSLDLTYRKGSFATLEECDTTEKLLTNLLSYLADEIEEENEHLEDILNSMYILSPEGSEL